MGRELDVRVAKALGDSEPPMLGVLNYFWEAQEDGTWVGEHHWPEDRAWEEIDWPPFYSSDIAAAWELVPLLPYFRLERLGYVWQCQSAHCGDMWDHSIMACGCVVVDAPTETEAICQAFLEWKEANDDRE